MYRGCVVHCEFGFDAGKTYLVVSEPLISKASGKEVVSAIEFSRGMRDSEPVEIDVARIGNGLGYTVL